MEITSEKKNDVLVISPLEKRLDAKVAMDFKENLVRRVKEDGYSRILINLDAIDFIDSAGLGAMVSVLKLIGKNGELKIARPRDQVKNMFDLTRLNLVFNIYDDVESALKSFN
ncbi:MAG: STAS domain-containing protein [Candidatus Zhuqueibacterota bacterium]